MPAADTAYLNIRQFLATQRQERFKSFLIHNPPLTGKTAFARQFAAMENGIYVDVLARVAESQDLSTKIDELDVRFLKSLALDGASSGAKLVVLDEFDFLVPVWSDDLTGLHELVRKLAAVETPAVVVFVLRTRSVIEGWEIQNTLRQSRILSLSSIQSLSLL